jgi:DHA2 family multidrug resistance protein
MLQGLMGYPAATAGLVTAPSGLGTMLAMVIVGRLVGKVDVRYLLAAGFGMTALSLWQMSRYTLVLSQSDIVWPGVIQGIGLGLVFVPLSTATFSTLSVEMRAEGTAIYSLVRNIGSSVGIALVQTLLTRNTQIAHASLTEHINVANPALQSPSINAFYGVSGMGAALLNSEITRQASMMGYVDDFWMMFLMTLAIIPLLILMRSARSKDAGHIDHAAME